MRLLSLSLSRHEPASRLAPHCRGPVGAALAPDPKKARLDGTPVFCGQSRFAWIVSVSVKVRGLINYTFLQMRAAAQETPSPFNRFSTCFYRSRSAKSARGNGSILIKEMGIFCTTSLSEILDLHNFWKHRDIHCRFRGFCEVMSFEYFLVLDIGI